MAWSDAVGQSASDSELLTAYRSGDGKAFGLLMERHIPLVNRLCSSFMSGHSHASVQDAVQTVFIILVRKSGELMRRTSLIGWLHRTAWFVTRNLRRGENGLPTTAVPDGVLEQVDSGMISAADATLADEVRDALHEAIAMLPESQRAAIVEHYFANKTYEQIATERGCSKTAVQSYIVRGRERLRKMLARQGVTLSATVLVTVLESEAAEEGKSLVNGQWSVEECSQQVRTTTDAVMAEMDRAAAKAMWGWIGAGAAGLATVGVGTALVVSHLQSMPLESNAPSKTSMIAPPSRPKVGMFSVATLSGVNGPFLPLSVNANGMVLGSYVNWSRTGTWQVAVWDGSGLRLLENKGLVSFGIGITRSGAVWGSVATTDDIQQPISPRVAPYPDLCGFCRTRAVSWRDGKEIGLCGEPSAITAVNASEIKVGWKRRSNKSEAVLWNASNECQTLPVPVGATRAVAMAISDAGCIVGAATDYDLTSSQPSRPWRAVIWEEGRVRELPIPENAVASAAFAVNDAGMVAGWWSAPDPESKKIRPRACVWTAGGVKDIGILGGESSVAMAVSSGGWVVGCSETENVAAGRNGKRKAFLWTAETGLVDLNDRLGNPADVELVEAWGVNDSGCIVGLAWNRGRGQVGFLLKPTERSP